MSAAADHRVIHLLQLVAHQLKTELDRLSLSEAGITAAQAAVMLVVASEPDATQRVVAEQLRQKESAITPMVARLSEAGLLDRSANPGDGRAWLLSLTVEGVKALKRFRGPLGEANKALTSALGGDAQVEAFAKALKAILDAGS